jgi:hypothetical protein
VVQAHKQQQRQAQEVLVVEILHFLLFLQQVAVAAVQMLLHLVQQTKMEFLEVLVVVLDLKDQTLGQEVPEMREPTLHLKVTMVELDQVITQPIEMVAAVVVQMQLAAMAQHLHQEQVVMVEQV